MEGMPTCPTHILHVLTSMTSDLKKKPDYDCWRWLPVCADESGRNNDEEDGREEKEEEEEEDGVWGRKVGSG